MILLVDVGNSRISIGISRDNKIIKTFSLETGKIKTRDEFALALLPLLELNKLPKEEITGACIASVVTSLNEALREALNAYLGIVPIWIEPGIKTGIILQVENPKEVGADLIADAIAAYRKYGGDNIIVNCGTATKVSFVNSKGEFKGVAIGIGYEVGAEALFTKTASLPHIALMKPDELLGKNTVNSLASGLYYSHLGGLRYMIKKAKNDCGASAKVILTGGNAGYFKRDLEDIVDFVNFNLTLEGLEIAYVRNKN